MKQVCINCEHWYFDAGEPDFSDVTPGTDWYMSCNKGHYWLDGHRVTKEQFRATLQLADTCADFREPA